MVNWRSREKQDVSTEFWIYDSKVCESDSSVWECEIVIEFGEL